MDKVGQLPPMKDYLASVNDRGECTMTFYQLNGFERYWTVADLGIQNMSRRIKHTRCQETMYDIDMKNMHPTLLSSYCQDHGIECCGLDNYMAHREEYLADLMRCALSMYEANRNRRTR